MKAKIWMQSVFGCTLICLAEPFDPWIQWRTYSPEA